MCSEREKSSFQYFDAYIWKITCEWLCINYLIYLTWLSYLACLYNVSVCMNKKVYYPQENLSQFDYPYQLFLMISTILVKNNPISRKHRNLCLFPCLQYRSKARPNIRIERKTDKPKSGRTSNLENTGTLMLPKSICRRNQQKDAGLKNSECNGDVWWKFEVTKSV